jgi:murein L,D-transpeptidase YcbB/YkuD
MEGDKMRSLRLATPVPVMIFYLTVTAEDDGRVLFLPDIYDHDRTLDQVLRSGHPRPV